MHAWEDSIIATAGAKPPSRYAIACRRRRPGGEPVCPIWLFSLCTSWLFSAISNAPLGRDSWIRTGVSYLLTPWHSESSFDYPQPLPRSDDLHSIPPLEAHVGQLRADLFVYTHHVARVPVHKPQAYQAPSPALQHCPSTRQERLVGFRWGRKRRHSSGANR
jgi:hypothetical protein